MQRGRYREFTQFDAEVIGSADPAADAELIALGVRWLESLGIGGLEVLVNSLGDADTRAAYRPLIQDFLDRHRDDLHPDVYGLRDVNPLRAFDTKHEASKAVMREAPLLAEALSPLAARAHLDAVRVHLDARGIAYAVDPTLVRGLDYYTHIAWEVVLPGARRAVDRARRRPLRRPRRGDRRRAHARRRLRRGDRPDRARARVTRGSPRASRSRAPTPSSRPSSPPRGRASTRCSTRRASSASRATPTSRPRREGPPHAGQLRVGARVAIVVGGDEWARGTSAAEGHDDRRPAGGAARRASSALSRAALEGGRP